jgi:hypothetical protein
MGMVKKNQSWIFYFLSAFLLISLAACTGFSGPSVTPTSQGQVPVSADFRDLYQSLGGEAELGPAISAPFSRNGTLCQYTTNVLMCYNPAARSEADRLYLAPVGLQLNFQDFITHQPGPLKVYEGFSEVYHNKFFVRYVGQPLTGVRYNPEKGRLEQYFEKMGFYTLLDDPQHTVHLLAYGSYVCREECSAAAMIGSGRSIVGWNKGIEVINPASLARLGNYTLFGSPLTNPYIAADGSLEQVLEKVVVYVPKDNPTTLRLRPLALALNLPYSDPGPQRYGVKENMVFYVVKASLGYHVPVVFDRFIATHGGTEISGKPLSDPYEVTVNNATVARQCFENYCLEYYPSAPEDQRVALASLGKLYMQIQDKEGQQVFQFNRKMIELTAAEQKPQISSQESQIIQIMLRTRLSKQPIAEIESFVTLALPDGKKLSYNLPPTNPSGLAQVTIPPLTNVSNGVIIPYIVCLNVPGDEQICANESFLVWNTR